MSVERLEALTNLLGMIDGKAPLSSEATPVVIAELQAENARLRSEVEPLRAEVADLQKQMSQLRASMGVPQIERAAHSPSRVVGEDRTHEEADKRDDRLTAACAGVRTVC
jgi:hypothetical protein